MELRREATLALFNMYSPDVTPDLTPDFASVYALWKVLNLDTFDRFSANIQEVSR
jgi:hypothetical protein